jgi:hypothetical protein
VEPEPYGRRPIAMTRFVRVILAMALVAAMAACAGPASEPTSSRLGNPTGFGGSAGAGANGPSMQSRTKHTTADY